MTVGELKKYLAQLHDNVEIHFTVNGSTVKPTTRLDQDGLTVEFGYNYWGDMGHELITDKPKDNDWWKHTEDDEWWKRQMPWYGIDSTNNTQSYPKN